MLVVIAILAVLLGLFLPAAQQIREVANRIGCQNHLKQLGVAALSHEATYGYLPSGGWGGGWIGEPDRGNGKDQPGGWIYQLLAFLDQGQLRSRGAGLPRDQQVLVNSEVAGTPLPILNCPSRRSGAPVPHDSSSATYYNCGPASCSITCDGNMNRWATASRTLSWCRSAKTDYHQEWLVNRLLVAGQPCIIGGPKNSPRFAISGAG
jgi:hypothetical protein